MIDDKLKIYNEKDINMRLKDISNNLKLLSTLAYKHKEKSFYKLIADELAELFDNELLGDINISKFKNNYYKTNINNEDVLFLKNNIFSEEKINVNEFLNQYLVRFENKVLPGSLSTEDREKLIELSNDKDIIKRNYSRQELNSTNFTLTLQDGEEDILISVLDEIGYFGITVKDYIEILKDNYDYENSFNFLGIFKNVFNNYIIELAIYLSKEIDNK